jgi:hypothetical protein
VTAEDVIDDLDAPRLSGPPADRRDVDDLTALERSANDVVHSICARSHLLAYATIIQ